MKTKNYPGNKKIEGLYQKIINQITPFENFIELFAGTGAITSVLDLKYKKAILFEIDSEIHTNLQQIFYYNNKVYTDQTNCIDKLKIAVINKNYFLNDFLFVDPPYHHDTRPLNTKLYNYELSHNDHVQLLQLLLLVNCNVMIIHPKHDLYDAMLANWRKIEVKVRYHNKTSIEVLYMNYPEPTELQDYRFLGNDCHDRQRIKRKVDAYKSKFDKMPVLERKMILEILG